MRRLLNSWMSRGSALLGLALMLGCAPADKPKTEPAAPAVEKPAADGTVEDATPEQDAAEEMKEEEKAAGPDAAEENGAGAPTENLDVPKDPELNLK